MAVLRLVYFDTNNEERTVSVDKDIFTIGRSSENDLSIPDSRLSRDHLEIERAYGEFTARDVGSSNGTKHNGYEISDAVVIKNGDEFDLGGGLQLKAVLEEEATEPTASAPAETAPATKKKAAAAPSSSSSSLLTTIILLVPAVGIVLLLLVGGVFLLVRDSGTDSNDQVYSDRTDTDDDDTPAVKTPTPKTASSDDNDTEPSKDPSDGGTTDGDDGPVTGPSPDAVTPESLAEKHGAEFLRSVAHNEPRAFLTGEQSRIVAQKIKSIASPTLAENIKSAKSNASQIKTIADSHNLKPQLLAAAAVAKLGGGRGDVVQTAKTMAEVLAVLRTQVGGEFGDDVLLMVAAYDQGAAGETMKMRNMLQAVTGQFPQVGLRTIRSIWFLKKIDKITDQQYELALRFLAVGTVMQNPKAFNVNAEPVVF
jgi:hypothetical protein